MNNLLKMSTPNNLEEAKPIKPEAAIDIEVSTEDSNKYIIKIWTFEEKLGLSTSYKKGLIIKEYFSSYDLKKLLENKNFTFKDINEYFLFLKDIIENNKKIKEEPKLKKVENVLYLEIPIKLGIIKDIKFEIKEKELNEREIQNNVMEFVNKIYLENEELKKKIEELQLDREKLKNKLEENQKNFEEKTKKQTERIKNLFKDSAIVRLDEKKMIDEWIDPYSEKNITSELLFRTSIDGDNATTFHNKCNGKGPTITFVKTTAGKRIGGFTMISWTSSNNFKEDRDAFIFSLDSHQKFIQYRNFGNAINDNSGYGPSFGNGNDLYIANGCKGNTSSYCNSNYSYNFYNSYNLINTGNQQTAFQVADYEVYAIKINK